MLSESIVHMDGEICFTTGADREVRPFFGKRERSRPTNTLYVLLPIVAIGYCSLQSDAGKAIRYSERVIAELEGQFENSGNYPKSLSPIYAKLGDPTPPIKIESYYIITGSGYQLRFHTVGGLFPEFHTYDSKTKEWRVQD